MDKYGEQDGGINVMSMGRNGFSLTWMTNGSSLAWMTTDAITRRLP
jgi:hypothetical protein